MDINLFTKEDVENLLNGKEVKPVIEKSSLSEEKDEIKREILSTVKRGLGFLQDWHKCPYCNTVFGLEEGREGICPNCRYRYFNERGSLVFKGRPAEEKEIEEEESEEEKEEEKEKEEEIKEKGIETVIIPAALFEDDEEVEVEKIGVADCPNCEKSVDWDNVESRNGFLRTIKECPKCRREAYSLDRNERIWSRGDVEEEEEFGLF